MYQPNQCHLQAPLFSDLNHLSEKARTRLDQSWAGAFYRDFFCRLDEAPFAVLYVDTPSRPNIPVNVLVGLEALKAGFGWSDAEMHDAFLFDVQVRYALGYRNLGEGDFDLRTVYNFRGRVSRHMRETGENLIEHAFVQITDEQIAAFQLKTGRLRMDSTQIASNIERMGRIQLLVEVLQRAHRMLSDLDQAQYADEFAPYLKGSSGQYVYHLKGQDTAPHLQRIGELMHRLLVELAPVYTEDETYQMLQRVFDEQFVLRDPESQPAADEDAGEAPPPASLEADESSVALATSDDTSTPMSSAVASTGPGNGDPDGASAPSAPSLVQVRAGTDISPRSLRSPDDPEATYRKKGHKAYEGYVTNITETCDLDNPFQLIVKVQTAPNATEDTTLLLETAPELKARLDVHTLYNDARYCSPEVDRVMRALQIEQVPSALCGKPPNPNRTTLADCHIQFDADGQPTHITCPHGNVATVEPGQAEGRYIARWADAPCGACHFKPCNRSSDPLQAMTVLRFGQADLDLALRRQRSRAYRLGKHKLRAAVEATVAAVKRPFSDDQLPVRGTLRMDQMMIGSAAMVNIRRIQRYLAKKNHPDRSKSVARQEAGSARNQVGKSLVIFLSAFQARFRCWLQTGRLDRTALALGF
jgi:hypothetical protein